MYDYVDGKVDWLAYGLPVEGDDGPFLGEQATEVPTCDATLTVADARRVLESSDAEDVLLVHGEGLVVGDVDAEVLDGKADDAPLLDVLRPVPSTVRPSVTVASVAEGGGGDRVVTTSNGRLMGRAQVEASDHHDHDHEGHDHEDHDHEGHDHEDAVDLDRYEEELAGVMKALADRFGDREASPEEVHGFLRDRLLAEGKSPEEADRFLEELGGGEGEAAP